jgi:hypothetical protein
MGLSETRTGILYGFKRSEECFRSTGGFVLPAVVAMLASTAFQNRYCPRCRVKYRYLHRTVICRA